MLNLFGFLVDNNGRGRMFKAVEVRLRAKQLRVLDCGLEAVLQLYGAFGLFRMKAHYNLI
jgi:hypothetical protein